MAKRDINGNNLSLFEWFMLMPMLMLMLRRNLRLKASSRLQL